ncbi:MAG: hypothetical protein AB8B53_12970 [Flavobacteriales bacterium]
MLKRIGYIALILILSSCRGCREVDSIVPLVQVDFAINIDEPQFFDLSFPTGWTYLSGGSRGILIYRNNIDQFSAYDRHAPYEVNEGCQVSVIDDGFTIEDPCSESTWIIIDGSVLSGPADQPLKQYNTQFLGNILRVFN